MNKPFRPVVLLAAVSLTAVSMVAADELTQIIQEDLAALGYDVGEVNGELSTKTAIAISRFQAENGLEVTGEASPQLAGIIKSKSSPRLDAAPKAETVDPAAQQAAQQACLQAKVAERQQAQKTKRGLGSLVSAIGRTAGQVGDVEMSSEIARASSDMYAANATAEDLQRAAEDLGLTEDDIEACRNPS